jgi:hypothetical protein
MVSFATLHLPVYLSRFHLVSRNQNGSSMETDLWARPTWPETSLLQLDEAARQPQELVLRLPRNLEQAEPDSHDEEKGQQCEEQPILDLGRKR